MVIAVCSFAIALDPEARSVGTAIGSAAPTVIRAGEAETFLRGVLDEGGRWESRAPLSDSELARFGALVGAAARPIDDVRGSAAYRRHALAVLGQPDARLVLAGAPDVRLTLHINDVEHEVAEGLGGREPDVRPARAARPAGRQERLRAGRVRVLLGDAGRGPGVQLPGARPPGRRAREVRTVEGLAPEGALSVVQQAFVDTGAVQCGFCTPGLVIATEDLLRRIPSPGDAEIREALAGNLCRCTGYEKILDAVRLASARGLG